MARQSKPRARRIGRLVLLLGLAIFLIWLGVTTVRTYGAARSLLSRQAEIEQLLDDGIGAADPIETTDLILAVRKDVRQLADATGPLARVAPLFTWLPRVGPLLQNAPHLLVMADAGTQAAAGSVTTFQSLLTLLQEGSAGGSVTAQLAQTLADGRSDLEVALAKTEQVAAARDRLQDEASLPWRVRTLLEQLDAELPLALDSLRLSLVLPDILAVSGQKTYLLIAQNEDELRPTGGYISGAGLLEIQGGQIVSIAFEDAGLVDDWQNKPYGSPPPPLQALMGSELFMFRDANYWPDFNRSAREVIRLYAYGRERQVDGLIAIDQAFLQSLLDVLGPVRVPAIDQAINAGNVIEQMRAQWEPGSRDFAEWMENRKSFMGPLAVAMMERVESGFSGIDPVYLVRALHAAAEERHLQLYLTDPLVQETIVQVGWDNAQTRANGDFLQVIDTNVGFNKANAIVGRTTTYRVTLSDRGGSAAVTVAYVNPAPADPLGCRPQAAYTLELRYRDLVEDCYWNYVRVYAPGGSVLQGASSHPVSGQMLVTGRALDGQARLDASLNGELAILSNFLLLPRDSQEAVEFRYELPGSVLLQSGEESEYRLLVKKQPGMEAERLRLVVNLPPGGQLLRADPMPATVSGQELSWNLELRTDVFVAVAFR